jgi:hypothetical protein
MQGAGVKPATDCHSACFQGALRLHKLRSYMTIVLQSELSAVVPCCRLSYVIHCDGSAFLCHMGGSRGSCLIEGRFWPQCFVK